MLSLIYIFKEKKIMLSFEATFIVNITLILLFFRLVKLVTLSNSHKFHNPI